MKSENKNNETRFVKAITSDDMIMRDKVPQVAFIGRSNVGKSSIINTICNNKTLAKSSSTPGRTKEINFFLFKNKIYLVDLPGYGYAKVSKNLKEIIKERILWYFLENKIESQKVILIVDAKVMPTIDDIDMFNLLRDAGKDLIIVANKIDKINQTTKNKNLKIIENLFSPFPVIAFSAEKKIGIDKLSEEMLK